MPQSTQLARAVAFTFELFIWAIWIPFGAVFSMWAFCQCLVGVEGSPSDPNVQIKLRLNVMWGSQPSEDNACGQRALLGLGWRCHQQSETEFLWLADPRPNQTVVNLNLNYKNQTKANTLVNIQGDFKKLMEEWNEQVCSVPEILGSIFHNIHFRKQLISLSERVTETEIF